MFLSFLGDIDMFSHVLSRSWLVDLVDLFPMALQVRSIAASDRAFAAAVLADGRREVAEKNLLKMMIKT